jgi:two-component system, chemotaxis family, CheB/CheR fusion protein
MKPKKDPKNGKKSARRARPPPSVASAPAAPASAPAGQAFPVVAIGASAGGLEALRRFFQAMPADRRVAFVVIVHLSPDHVSHFAELLRGSTSMPVAQIDKGDRVEAGHVYVIPPNRFVRIEDGVLRLDPTTQRPVIPRPIDHFLRSLAEERQEHAVAVILSGTDSDGTLGVKEIKIAGGMVMAQTPESAQHPGMPKNAIATGVVDYVLPIEEMPRSLLAYLEHAKLDGAAAPAVAEAEQGEVSAEQLHKALALLHLRAGHDFRLYKPGMLMRRIFRRMGLARTPAWADYEKLLRDSAKELQALRGDLLIGVTEFFREPEAFDAFEREAIPQLLENRPADSPLRVWVPGCATGEEAYSLAMLLIEAVGEGPRSSEVNVFATDVDRDALDVGRQGTYRDSIALTMPPQRLRRFFNKTDDGYQVKSVLRKAVLFAPHNVMTDPPFSRLDVVSCRNLLIYLESEVQRKLMRLFHFALRPGGTLLLGKSESPGQSDDLFEPVSKKHRIFRSVRAAPTAPLDLPLGRSGAVGQPQADVSSGPRDPDFRKLIEAVLLREHAPAAVLADRRCNAMYFHGSTGEFLSQPGGQPTADLASLVPANFRVKLRAAFHEAIRAKGQASFDARGEGGAANVRVTVAPLRDFDATGLLVVTFQRRPRPRAAAPEPRGIDDGNALRQLEQELDSTRKELQGAIEDMESANEELKVSNEEAMSMNEELQSTNEELETSKEELQSLNEELTSVNVQLEEKVHELERANDDQRNLLTSTEIATLFLDRELRIKRFTPACTRLFKLIATDVERPITDLAGSLASENFLEDARRVLAELNTVEREVRAATGEWYLRRVVPYRTQDERIDGVVATFTDVSELRRATEGVRRLATVVRDSNDAVIVFDFDGHILSWNRGAEAIYGYTEKEALRLGIDALVPERARGDYRALLERSRTGEGIASHETQRTTRDGRTLDIWLTASVLHDEAGGIVAIASTERDITERRRAELALRESEARFKLLADSAPVLIRVDDVDGKARFVNRVWLDFTARPVEALLGDGWLLLLHPGDQTSYASGFRRAVERLDRFEGDFRLRRADGEYRWMKSVSVPRYDQEGGFSGYIGTCFDIHDRKLTEQALAEADRRKDEFLAMLAHELRNPLAPISNAARLIKLIGLPDARLEWARDVIDRQVGHLARLIDDLLDVSRITSGRLELHKDVLDLKSIVEQAVEASRPLIEARRHRIEVELPQEPVYVEGDLVRLSQAITNLVNNAAKYTNEGGWIRVRAERGDGSAVISVSDNGIGIDADLLPRVFDLFTQGDRSLERTRGGLGIGLTLVQRLIEMHGGSIEARSHGVNRGSEFVIRLPALVRPSDALRSPKPAPTNGAGRRRILVVDDNVDSAESMAAILRMEGHEVETAYDGMAALKAAESTVPQVVLLDIGLPGLDGYELARRLRARPQTNGALLIAITGYGQAEDVRTAMEAGINCHLVKPVNREALDAILASAGDA